MNDDAAPEAVGAAFQELDPGGASGYRVTVDGADVGTVRPFRLGAGQFGSGWAAESPAGERSTGFATREAAADWLVERTRR
jgi:hypothetical protein